jgi:citrate lyase subunit beta/citryl-CoA lyase
MIALHPAQIAIINDGFTPSASEVARARAIIAAFAAQPDAGVLRLDGKMIDRPHLIQARRIVAAAQPEG